MTDHIETSLPVLIFTVPSIPGDTDALATLTVDNDDATNPQGWLIWGLESNRYYTFTDSSGSGALFYQSESRTAMGGSATATQSGASGAGSNVMRSAALTGTNRAIMGTQATGGGAHLTHVGSFRVWVRVLATLSGTLSVSLQWGTGDLLSSSVNPAATLGSSQGSEWRLLDLGMVTIPAGSASWE